MTDPDDTTIGTDDIDALFEALLRGDEPTGGAPGWGSDVAVLVHAARAPAAPDELAREDDIVARMRQVRLEVGSGAVTPAPVTDLGVRRLARDPDRTYRAKHAAARLEMSRHPAVRTIGRVVAMKAAAVTTVAVISVAAAAAATTGIVATVVVPALTPDEPRNPATATTTTERPRSTATATPGDAGWADAPGLADCPMLPACPDATDPAVPPAEVVPPTTPTTTATSVPGELSTTAQASTTTAPPATAPPTTETTTPPTSTTAPEDTVPDPGPLVADSPPGKGRSVGAAHGSSGRG
jgi:hypothetical protein